MIDEYVIINELNKWYPYNVYSTKFASKFELATIRTYSESRKEIDRIINYISSCNFTTLGYKLKIVSVRKIKLEALNEL